MIFKNTPWHYFKISFVIQAGGSGAGRILAHTVFVLKMRRVQDLCSTSSQVTLSSFGFIYKRNAFSLRGAAGKQLYAPAPESSSDEETPTPEASRDAATWSAWQDGEGHCEQTGDGPCVPPLPDSERDRVRQTLRLRVHTKARSHLGVKWDWRGCWPAGGVPPLAYMLFSTYTNHPPIMEMKWEF